MEAVAARTALLMDLVVYTVVAQVVVLAVLILLDTEALELFTLSAGQRERFQAQIQEIYK
tara:strand:- start:456 stop:635 length:180 start_codon:yes stop_codon:yes gene_type:complete